MRFRHRFLAAAVISVPSLAFAQSTSGTNTVILETALDGRQEVVNNATDNSISGDPNGRGTAYVFGVVGDPLTLCYVIQVEKIEPATMTHIHLGAAGSNGPVVINFAPPTDGNTADCVTEGDLLPNGSPVFRGSQTAAAVLANPTAYYVNIHNAVYPAGAIRGQLAVQPIE